MKILFQRQRKSSPGNLFSYCLCFSRVLRFLKSDTSKVKAVQGWCRSYQKAYENKDRSWQRLSAQKKWLAWADVLQVVKQQKESYESSGGCELTRARESQKYTVLLLYTCIPPARSKEYRELKVTHTLSNLILWQPQDDPVSNWLVVQSDHSKAILYLGSHKTSRRTGPNKVELRSSDSTGILFEQLLGFVFHDRDILLRGSRSPETNHWLFVVRKWKEMINVYKFTLFSITYP